MLNTRNEHSAGGQSYFRNKQTRRKRHQICGYQRWGGGERELNKSGQKVETCSYKRKEVMYFMYIRAVMYDMINILSTAVRYV